MTVNIATARYDGLGKEGRGHVATKSGAIDAPYGFATRFEGQPGINPEEMVAAAHASCFTMATSLALAGAGHNDGTLETECQVTLDKDGAGFAVTRSALKLTGKVPGIDRAEFERLAGEAKAGCPISKLLNCEITLEAVLAEEMVGEAAGG
jgi:osmotically inducible protein OsmC